MLLALFIGGRRSLLRVLILIRQVLWRVLACLLSVTISGCRLLVWVV